MKNLHTWKIAYTIEDGPYECYDYLLRQAAGEMTEAAAAAVAAFWCADDERDEAGEPVPDIAVWEGPCE